MSAIETKPDYEVALERAYALMDAAPGSPEEAELVLLSRRIEAYEEEHYHADFATARQNARRIMRIMRRMTVSEWKEMFG